MVATSMSMQGTSVSSEQRGYSRGLILGLTMAESMLLLVFCLLLAAGAIVVGARGSRARESGQAGSGGAACGAEGCQRPS